MSDEKRRLAEAYYMVAADMQERAQTLLWAARGLAEYADHLSEKAAAEKAKEPAGDVPHR